MFHAYRILMRIYSAFHLILNVTERNMYVCAAIDLSDYIAESFGRTMLCKRVPNNADEHT